MLQAKRDGGFIFNQRLSKKRSCSKEGHPAWRPHCNIYWDNRTGISALIWFCLVFQGIILAEKVDKDSEERGESTVGVENQRASAHPQTQDISHLGVCKGNSWHTQSSVISQIIYQAPVLCLVPGPDTRNTVIKATQDCFPRSLNNSREWDRSWRPRNVLISPRGMKWNPQTTSSLVLTQASNQHAPFQISSGW